MAKDRSKIRIYGDADGAVFVAPKGTTGPTTLAAPAGTFVEVGWLSEDGIDQARDESTSDFYAWQGATLVRTKCTSVKDSIKFVCLEETALTLGLHYKGVAPTTAGSVDTYAVSNQAKSDERAWVVDNYDGTVQKRYVIPSGEITARGTVSHKNSDITMYEFTVTIYGDYSVLKTTAA